jgi:SAM-dependent methyltransferase
MSLSDPTGFQTLRVIAEANHFNKWMFESIRPYLKGSVLEIGSGIGNLSQFVLEEGFQLTLSDYDSEYKHYLEAHFRSYPNVLDILSIDLQATDFRERYASLEGSFDTVFLLNVIEHLRDDLSAMEYCRFLLKPEGQLIVLAPAYSWLFCRMDRELGHYRRYTSKKLASVIERAGFFITKRHYFNFFGMAGWGFFGKLLGSRQIRSTEMKFYNKLVPMARLLDKITRRSVGLSAIVIAKKC